MHTEPSTLIGLKTPKRTKIDKEELTYLGIKPSMIEVTPRILPPSLTDEELNFTDELDILE